MHNSPNEELIAITQHLLDAIGAGDWKTYVDLCDPSLTCFEPEARGHLVAGLEFHRYYFELERSGKPSRSTIASPHVRMLGPDAAAVCYTRLVQSLDAAGRPHTACVEETRLWQRHEGRWRHVHFHRSPVT
jgi:calcium/calmodulin-dependent protein kinase (CaM kinase) II